MPDQNTAHDSAALSLPTVAIPSVKMSSSWNTSNLGLRVATDAASAVSASALVAPIICVIDRSIVEKAATGNPLWSCLKRSLLPAVTRPHTFLASRPFLLIFGLYTSTYLTANSMDTLSSTMQNKPANTVSSGAGKFAATSAVNMTACVYKDSQFARIFGKPASPSAVLPRLSFALFAARDSMTIFASFNLPTIIAPRLAELPAPVKERFSSIISTEKGRTTTAQFIAPAAMQIFSTPIHLLGLDLYNRQGRISVNERVARIVRDWGVSALARMGRIVPAFGVGGVVNTRVRRELMEKLES